MLAAPFWSTIDRMAPAEKARQTYLRSAFSGMLVTGPFSIIVGFTGGILALNDRLKLRSMVVGGEGQHRLHRQRGERHPGPSPRSWTPSTPPRAGNRWSTGWKGGGEAMAALSFTKMQGCGNDYIYIDCFRQQVADPAALAVRLSHRHKGIGGDGVILICPSEVADAKMRMFNLDGSEGAMCGNGVRCVAKYVYDQGGGGKKELRIETRSGIKTCRIREENGQAALVTVDMGRQFSPRLPCRSICPGSGWWAGGCRWPGASTPSPV